jgi:hypothetical protein
MENLHKMQSDLERVIENDLTVTRTRSRAASNISTFIWFEDKEEVEEHEGPLTVRQKLRHFIHSRNCQV